MTEKQTNLKPCPFCGSDHLFADEYKVLFMRAFAIGCLNVECSSFGELFLSYGLTREQARRRAMKARNKRFSDGKEREKET